MGCTSETRVWNVILFYNRKTKLSKLRKIQTDGGLEEGLHYNDMQPIDLTPSTNQEIEIGSLNKKQSALFRPSLTDMKGNLGCLFTLWKKPCHQT